MKLVCLGSELTERQCWHFVPMLLLLLFTVASISANQSAASRLVRQATGQVTANTQAPLQAANLGASSSFAPPFSSSPQQPMQKQKEKQQQRQAQTGTLPTTSTSPPKSSTLQSSPKLPQAPKTTTMTTGKQQPPKSSGKSSEQNEPQQQQCEYEKEAWQACQSNGVQERVLRLKRGSKCEPVKIMRRECRIGCKYARGEWSSSCTDGLRVRVDTLVGYTNPNSNELENLILNGQLNANETLNNNDKLDHSSSANKQHQKASSFNCQPERKVTKDCRRACHYIKSAWSDCVNGFKTRNLTLDETPLLDDDSAKKSNKNSNSDAKTNTHQPTSNSVDKEAKLLSLTGPGCIKQKQVRRECRRRELQNVSNKVAQTSSHSPTASSAKLLADKQTPAQRRRLKQLQRQQQQQQQKERQQSPPASRTEETTARSKTLTKGR